jgi:hypothetical protein
MTHPHNDHIGYLIYFLQERMTKVLIPRGSLLATRISLENRMQFLPRMKAGMEINTWEQSMLTQIDYLDNLFNQGDELMLKIEKRGGVEKEKKKV